MIKNIVKKKDLKTITYKLNPNLISEFREICKKHNIKQVAIIENAMKSAIKELKNEE